MASRLLIDYIVNKVRLNSINQNRKLHYAENLKSFFFFLVSFSNVVVRETENQIVGVLTFVSEYGGELIVLSFACYLTDRYNNAISLFTDVEVLECNFNSISAIKISSESQKIVSMLNSDRFEWLRSEV